MKFRAFSLVLTVAVMAVPSPSLSNSGVAIFANGAESAAVGGAQMNATAYERFKAWCSTNPAACVLAGIAAGGVIAHLMTAKKAKGIEDDLDCASTNSCFNYDGGYDPYHPTNRIPNLDPRHPGDRRLVELERRRPEFERAERDLRNRGIKKDPKTGGYVDAKGNPVTMANASEALGMSPEDQKIVDEIAKEAAKDGSDLLKKIREYDEDYGGGGGGSGSNAGYTSPEKKRFPSAYPGGLNAADPSVAGLSINHGSDSIGVAGDNIFDMIHRRYEQKRRSMNPQNPIYPGP